MEAGKKSGLIKTLPKTGWAFVQASAACLMLLSGNAPASEQGLSSDEVRELKTLSRALLVTRAVSRQETTEVLQAERTHIQAVHDALASLESTVRSEMMRVEVNPAGATVAAAAALRPVQRAPVAARFEAATGTRAVLPEASQAAPAPLGRPLQPSSEPLARSAARAASRDRAAGAYARRRARVNQALDEALSQIATRRALLAESLEQKRVRGAKRRAGPAVRAQGGHAKRPQATRPGQRAEDRLRRIEAELAKLRQSDSLDLKKISQLRESVAFKRRLSLQKETKPTLQTITKHRRAQQ